MKSNIVERLAQLRAYMQENSLQAFIVVSSDAHSSEYVANHWKSREWISGFDGSAGTAVITLDDARLWTDSRYWLAAEEQLNGTGYTLMKDGDADTPSIVEWLCSTLSEGDTVGVDGTVCTIAEVSTWFDTLSKKGIDIDESKDPFAQLWSDRPSTTPEFLVAHIIKQLVAEAGDSVAVEKLNGCKNRIGVMRTGGLT